MTYLPLAKRFQAYREFHSVRVDDVPSLIDCILFLVRTFQIVTFTELTEVLRPFYGVNTVRQEVWKLIESGTIDFTLERGLQIGEVNGIHE